MSWIDLLRMSGSNLKRRKLRTFLTVLGVIIGTASIVVMISLGLGLQESLYQEVEQSGGLPVSRCQARARVIPCMLFLLCRGKRRNRRNILMIRQSASWLSLNM